MNNKTGNQGLSNPNRRKARDDMGRSRLEVWNQITFLSLFVFIFYFWMNDKIYSNNETEFL